MNLKKHITKISEKKGSYILEATILLPVFILSIAALISILGIIRNCENSVFISADETNIVDVKAHFAETQFTFPSRLCNRILEENSFIKDAKVKNFRYKYNNQGMEDLISFKLFCDFGRINFSARVLSRGFTGQRNYYDSLDRSSFENDDDFTKVYIFPAWGEKYHNSNCTYIKANCKLVVLNKNVLYKYKPCSLCHSEKAVIGSPVFLFERSGNSYHLGTCKQVKKYYIEIDKKEAIKRGYSCCSKCGG